MRFHVADNSYAVSAENIANNRKKYQVKIGDVLRVVVKTWKYGKFKKKDVLTFGVVIRTRKSINRQNSYIKFDDNAIILVDNLKDLSTTGNKIKGTIGIEILQQYTKFKSIIKIADMKQFK